ncbi:EVE domain-containing protein [Simiduia agarivorans]|uniref:KAP family P-loop domain-containing protein n=1 Tax=Simiduia agarivorans (strain DSM 21679 / JCM 13881 / BCRC 17597 / SA1) TaxID=1117647 RepID=K4KJH3_SIMAS|nr:EVE domain-containing protein [Simiduia agarivorans]AFU98365.1 KAP family P-loop domain-containing protein [Simiduia agarivorans SA1 = DSM 21679]
MSVFIFQSIPERFDLELEVVEGKKDTWYATRYRKRMKLGDIVFFWMAGADDRKGMYGWGVIESEPYIRDDWQSYGVDVVYEKKFCNKLSKRKICADQILKNMLLFRAPQATNFLLTDEESRALIDLINKCGEMPPKLGGNDA